MALLEQFYHIVDLISGFIWGGSWGDAQIVPPYASPMVVGLLGTGAYFMIATGLRPLRRLVPAFAELWSGRKSRGEGEITPWQALSTALSGQVGTGNLAGVATALALGGPGAIFWMWITAIFGMAAAFAESSLAVRFREKHADGRVHGGPMYYIKNGLGKGWGWLAVLFCIGTLFSATATGGMIQANSITQSVVETGDIIGISIPSWTVGLVLGALVFAVIIGGIKSIGSVAGKVVPFMALLYVLVALIVLILHAENIPGAFATIISSAFGLEQAAGGVAGYGVVAAIRYGVARGLFSNEAGQGSAPIAHAAAQTSNPVRQGEIAMIGVFIDTIIICTMTALAILVVTGDFKRSPALYAFEVCDRSKQLSMSELTIGEVTLGDGTVLAAETATGLKSYFPRVDQDVSGYSDTVLAHQGERAVAILRACEAAGVPFLTDELQARVRANRDTSAEQIAEWRSASFAQAIAAAQDGRITPDEYETVDRAYKSDLEASAITTQAYANGIPYGNWLVTIALFFFAFTTIIGWSYYAETAITYLFGDGFAKPFRFIWVGVIFLGTLQEVDLVWRLGDLANASMAFPNLIAILGLSGVVLAMGRQADKARREGEE